VLHLVSLTAKKVVQSPPWIGPKLDRNGWGEPCWALRPKQPTRQRDECRLEWSPNRP